MFIGFYFENKLLRDSLRFQQKTTQTSFTKSNVQTHCLYTKQTLNTLYQHYLYNEIDRLDTFVYLVEKIFGLQR
jgi:hypothetical protein